MKITKRQLKRIIREEYSRLVNEAGVGAISPTARNYRAKAEQEAPAPIRGEDDSDWVIWADQFDMSPEWSEPDEDGERQLYFYLPKWTSMNDPVAMAVVEEAEELGAEIEHLPNGRTVIYTGEYE